MRLSIVVPCWNCSKTIGRLLDSVLANNLDKIEYEVIICDDKSTDNFLDVVKTYEDKMNIVYCTTNREVHCPGNTRQAALPYIHGEWFTFIDNDDLFEPDAFKNVFDYIEKNNVEYTLCTYIREYYQEEQRYGREIVGEETDTWLHGKFFNKKNTLDVFKCYFQDDLMSHEDVFFNSCNLARLISIDKDYVYYPIFTYKQVYRKDSLSRSYFDTKDYYIDTYLGDFLIGASYPFFGMYLREKDADKKEFALNQIMMTMLHGYFYYQASVWRLGPDDTLIESYDALKVLKRRIIKELGLTQYDIVNYIYQRPERYSNIKKNCFKGSCPFVEVQSFKDFILNL